MSHIELASEVGDVFERILDHLVKYQVESPALRIREIIEAINVLEYNPMIGRPANNNKREASARSQGLAKGNFLFLIRFPLSLSRLTRQFPA